MLRQHFPWFGGTPSMPEGEPVSGPRPGSPRLGGDRSCIPSRRCSSWDPDSSLHRQEALATLN